MDRGLKQGPRKDSGMHSEQTKTITWYIALVMIALREREPGTEVGQIPELNMWHVPVTQEEQHIKKQEETASTVERLEKGEHHEEMDRNILESKSTV